MDLSILVVLAALIALLSPIWVRFTRNKSDKNQPLSEYKPIPLVTAFRLGYQPAVGDRLLISHHKGRLLLYDLIQEDKTRIV